MKLSKTQRDKLWGEIGPYSEAYIKIEHRILDDRLSCIFLLVEANINPLTFEIIKKHRSKFKNDIKIMQLLESAEYRRIEFGYVVCAFREQYVDEGVMKRAQKSLEYTKETIIKMHKFVMDLISEDK